MRWWFCVPGALVPAEVARHAVMSLPEAIVRALCRAAIDSGCVPPASDAPHLDWLWQRFGGAGDPVVAPYLWSMLSIEPHPSDGTVWCCVPVHFALARDHMLVSALDATVTRDDIVGLMQVAADVAGQHGASIVEQGGHWFVRTEAPWQLATVALDAALGRSLTECWPEGADALRWRKLLTEVQVEWHQHPINEQREEQGRPEINGLWLHGGGVSRQLSASAFASIACDDPRVNAWAHAGGMPHERRLGNDALPPAGGDAVTLIGNLLPAFNADDWGGWMHAWNVLAGSLPARFERAQAAGFELSLQLFGATESRVITLAAGDRWRFWRGANRARAAALLTDTGA